MGDDQNDILRFLFTGLATPLLYQGNIAVRSGQRAILYSGTLSRSSSRELKENIDPFSIPEAFDALEKLNPVKYNLKADSGKRMQIGFIAEDVPELVSTTDKKAIINDNIVAILTKVVKEQQKMIEKLIAKVDALENN